MRRILWILPRNEKEINQNFTFDNLLKVKCLPKVRLSSNSETILLNSQPHNLSAGIIRPRY